MLTHMSLHYMHELPMEARRGCQIPWNWSYKSSPRPLQGSTAESALQLLHLFVKSTFRSFCSFSYYNSFLSISPLLPPFGECLTL